MLRRQKHVLSQSTTPFACTLTNKEGKGGGEEGGNGGRVNRARREQRGKNEGKRVGGKGPEKALEKL